MTWDYVKDTVYLLLKPSKCTLCFYLRADIFDINVLSKQILKVFVKIF